jgi:sulfotransferase family protein
MIGAMKSGTTSLARSLGAHPDVYLLPGKSTHFFDRDFARGVAWYGSCFVDGVDARVVGEATNEYMSHPDAVPRMASVIPDARLIAILRNPVDRCYSHYWHQRIRGREPLEFRDALAAESARQAEDPSGMYAYTGRSCYVAQLERVVAFYPRSSLHVILFEDLRDDPVAVYRAVCRFVGVDDEVVPEELGRQFGGFVRFRSLRVRALQPRMPKALSRVVGRFNAERVGYPPMPDDVRRELTERFEPEVAALSSWLSRDVSAWSGRSGELNRPR